MAAPYLPPVLGSSLQEFMFPNVKTTVNLFGVHMRQVDGVWDYPVHEHSQYEINYVLDGEQQMTINGTSYVQQAGDLLLIRPGEEHSSRSANGQPFTYFCLHFNIDDHLFLSLLGRMKQVLFPSGGLLTTQVVPVLHKLITIAGEDDETSIVKRMRMQSAAFELFGNLLEALSQEAISLSADSYERFELANRIRSRLQAIVGQTFKRSDEHTTSDKHYGIDDIAEELGISVSHCNRVFRHVYGQSPRAYLSELVLHEAKLLLADPQLPVQTISSVLGYRDIAHFSRQFKRWAGVSPSDYRRQVADTMSR
ncbi:AraC family transcriptional regulator [Paenibacillus cellulosilyticus]|uniref:AraC family transcriptional regulator n=1 Tax=Paenibacillus cellulosilyticus TaxID=375489 RepID=A0A2V2YH75_9BACL|nr:AraC family transcriptional regulator [Paenibacillus cellulosilyticus]PWV92501.1 AraC family transcriptional regulator [Paenibacillus cellulosilyticus]